MKIDTSLHVWNWNDEEPTSTRVEAETALVGTEAALAEAEARMDAWGLA